MRGETGKGHCPANKVQNRRDFLRVVGGGLAGTALAGWSDSAYAIATGANGFTLIDTHTHFYDPTRAEGMPWPPREDKLLYRKVLPQDYRALSTPAPVTGTVVVEASPWVEDNQWVLNLAAQDPFIVGVVGNLPIGTNAFAGHLRRFATNPLFRGIRIRDRKLDDLLAAPSFFEDLKLLADNQLALDLVGGLEILAFANRLTKALPNLRLVIDHLAGLPVDGKTPPTEWKKQMKTIASAPNIYCKLSGLVEGTGRVNGDAPREVGFYRPVLDVMCELFPTNRLMYASNWPVSERFAPLAVVQGIVADYFRSHGSAVERSVFSQSAKAAYQWVERKKSSG